MDYALERVRDKLLNTAFWSEPRPCTPESFVRHSLTVLNEHDFQVLDAFERDAGEHAAEAWLSEVLREGGCGGDAAEPIQLREAASPLPQTSAAIEDELMFPISRGDLMFVRGRRFAARASI